MDNSFKIYPKVLYSSLEYICLLLVMLAGLILSLIDLKASETWDGLAMFLIPAIIVWRMIKQLRTAVFENDSQKIHLIERNGFGKPDRDVQAGHSDIKGFSQEGDAVIIHLINNDKINIRHLREADIRRMVAYLSGLPVAKAPDAGPGFCIDMPLWDKMVKALYVPLIFSFILFQILQSELLNNGWILSCMLVLSYLGIRRFLLLLLNFRDKYIFRSDGHYIYNFVGDSIVAAPLHEVSDFTVGTGSSSHKLVLKDGGNITSQYLRRKDIRLLGKTFAQPGEEIILIKPDWETAFKYGFSIGVVIFLILVTCRIDGAQSLVIAALSVIGIGIGMYALQEPYLIKEHEDTLEVYHKGKFVKVPLSEIACFTTQGKGNRFILKDDKSIVLSTRWISLSDVELLQERFPASAVNA